MPTDTQMESTNYFTEMVITGALMSQIFTFIKSVLKMSCTWLYTKNIIM